MAKNGKLAGLSTCSQLKTIPYSMYGLKIRSIFYGNQGTAFNPHLRGRGTICYSQSEWLFLLKFLCTKKIVNQFVFLVQSIVFIHMFQNL